MQYIVLVICVFILGFYSGDKFSSNEVEKIVYKKQDPIIIYKDKIIIKEVEIDSIKNSARQKTNKQILIKKTNVLINKQTDNNDISIFELFKINIDKLNYDNAFEIYENDIGTNNIENYQRYLYEHINNLIGHDNKTSMELVDRFLLLEYDNSLMMYLKSKIYFEEKEYYKSILTLIDLRDTYVDEIIERDISLTTTEYINEYIKILKDNDDLNRLIDFLKLLIENHFSNGKYIYMLGITYFNINDYDNSLKILENLRDDEEYSQRAMEIIDNITKKIEISQKYSIKIKLKKQGVHYLVDALLNNEKKVKLLLDTGASKIVIHESIINELEHTIINNSIEIKTAGGIVEASLVSIASIFVGEAFVKKIKIISSGIKNEKFDGLLGMNFLEKFDFYIDQQNSILHLNPKL